MSSLQIPLNCHPREIGSLPTAGLGILAAASRAVTISARHRGSPGDEAYGSSAVSSEALSARVGVTWGERRERPADTEKSGRRRETVEAYLERAKGLFARCRSERSAQGLDTTFGDFVVWLIVRKGDLKATTWGLYRVSVLEWFEDKFERMLVLDARDGSGPHAGKALADFLRARDRLQTETRTGCASKSRRTSAAKAKRFPEADRVRIEERAMSTASPKSAALCDFLRASVRAGLRPTEWWGTSVVPTDDEQRLVLLVPNAKADDTRAHGPTRTLTFDRLPAEDRLALTRWIERVPRDRAAFDKVLKSLSDFLYKLCRQLWPNRKKHYALYSTRHEFAAVAKLAYSPEEVAALMGHASDETATDHYGRYRAGKGGLPSEIRRQVELLPRPQSEEVARVRRVLVNPPTLRYDQG